VPKNYPFFKRALLGLKGFNEKEAEAFFELCSNKTFCVKDVMKSLVAVGAPNQSRTTAYNLVEKFKDAQLISPIEDGNKKQSFECVHPRTIYNMLKNDLANAEKELPELETLYEMPDFKAEDPSKKARLLGSENSISSICYSLHKEYQITIVHDKSIAMRNLLEKIKDCGEVLEGNTNVILFKNEEKKICGVIEICKKMEKGDTVKLYGYIIYDQEKYNYFQKKEVER